MKIRSVRHNDRKKVFEVRTSTKKLVFPFSKAEPTPTIHDAIADLFVDEEVGREAFYLRALRSGRTGTIHIEQVLEHNLDFCQTNSWRNDVMFCIPVRRA